MSNVVIGPPNRKPLCKKNERNREKREPDMRAQPALHGPHSPERNFFPQARAARRKQKSPARSSRKANPSGVPPTVWCSVGVWISDAGRSNPRRQPRPDENCRRKGCRPRSWPGRQRQTRESASSCRSASELNFKSRIPNSKLRVVRFWDLELGIRDFHSVRVRAFRSAASAPILRQHSLCASRASPKNR